MRWALDHMNDFLADLCRKAGIRRASSDSGSDDDSGSDEDWSVPFGTADLVLSV